MIDERPEPNPGGARPSGVPDAGDPSDTPTLVADGSEGGEVLPERELAPPGPSSDRYLGCTIDNRYKVEGIIGEGGMGVVYQCRHKIIDKRVALKILRADVARDPEVTERFLMEAKAASAIQDEHIISISDFGQLPDGAAYFVMEFLEGTPLAMIAGGGSPMPLPRILRIALQLSEGLGAAHQLGIVHRDLKPDNVFLIQRGKEVDFVKILDFGIAKVSTSTGGRRTQIGSVFGTPHYMSPEQAAGTPLDHRGDIYSLGVMLYELATGRVPFDAENFVGILSQQLYQDPVPPRAAAPHANIPPAFEAIILTCMAKKAEQRYQSMSHLRDDLVELQARLSTSETYEPKAIQPLDIAASVDGTALSTELSLASLRPRRWPMYAAIAAPLAVVVGIFATKLSGNVSPSSSTPPPHEQPLHEQPLRERPSQEPLLHHQASPSAESTDRVVAPGTLATLPASSPAASAASADEVKTPVQVLLGVAPTTAHVFMGDRDLGASPVQLDVSPGSPVSVEVRHPKYVTRQLELDGSERKVSIELEPKSKRRKKKSARTKNASRAAPQPVAPSTAQGATPAEDKSIGGQLFVEPWQKP